MTDIVLPKLSQTGTNEWADVEDNDKAIRDVVNGQLTNGNLSGSAGITDANLASPNNSAYRTILQTNCSLNGNANGAVFLMGGSQDSGIPFRSGTARTMSTGSSPPDIIYFDDADYTVAGKTQKLRIRAQLCTNATAPGKAFTVALYPLTVAGAANEITYTVGTVVASSLLIFSAPSASTITSGVVSDFTIPSDGAYVLCVVPGGTPTSDSITTVHAQLQTRWV